MGDHMQQDQQRKVFYAGVRDKKLYPIQGMDILAMDGIVYDRKCQRGKNTKWRKAYMLPRNVQKLGIEFKKGETWPLKIKYRGYVLDLITDSRIVNKIGQK